MKLVIKPHRPVRRALLLVGLGACAAFAAVVALDYGDWQRSAHAMVSSGQKRTLLEEVTRLDDENAALRFELAQLRRAEEIGAVRRRGNRDEIMALQSEVAALNQELEFYRDIVGGAEVEGGPRVKGVEIRSLDDARRYRYRLVLMHVDEDDRMAEGTVRIGLRGDLAGQRKALSFAEVVESGPDVLAFKFKHFRLFEGTIKLPEGFVPRQISVAVHAKSRGRDSFAETYDWASVLN
jgi:hypothetical protein